MAITEGEKSKILSELNSGSLLDDLYIGVCNHPNLLGDCLLAKANLLKNGKKIRKNPKFIKLG